MSDDAIPRLSTDTLAGMVAQKMATCASQKYAAENYAHAMAEHAPGSEYPFGPEHWSVVNRAILRRWPKGLKRVKRMAWRIIEAWERGPTLRPEEHKR